jgi:hypothetical protein
MSEVQVSTTSAKFDQDRRIPTEQDKITLESSMFKFSQLGIDDLDTGGCRFILANLDKLALKEVPIIVQLVERLCRRVIELEAEVQEWVDHAVERSERY